jgi:hypothetical protein
VLGSGGHALQYALLALPIVGGDEEGISHIPAKHIPVAWAAQFLEEAWDGRADAGRQDDGRIQHDDDGGGKFWIPSREVEGDYAAHAVPDHHRLFEPEPLAHPRKIVGEDLHRVRLVRLVAPSVPAQVHGHDTATCLCEVVELGPEVGVVAAPAVHQQDGRLPLPLPRRTRPPRRAPTASSNVPPAL